MFKTVQYAEGKSEDKLANVIKKFEESRQNTIYERYRFQCRNQKPSITLPDGRQASCDFAHSTSSRIIKDCFVHVITDSKFRERLLRDKHTTLEKSPSTSSRDNRRTDPCDVRQRRQPLL